MSRSLLVIGRLVDCKSPEAPDRAVRRDPRYQASVHEFVTIVKPVGDPPLSDES